jgi:hypothetical protein
MREGQKHCKGEWRKVTHADRKLSAHEGAIYLTPGTLTDELLRDSASRILRKKPCTVIAAQAITNVLSFATSSVYSGRTFWRAFKMSRV